MVSKSGPEVSMTSGMPNDTKDEIVRQPRTRVSLGHGRRRLSFEKRLRIWLTLMGVPMFIFCIALLIVEHAEWPTIALAITALLMGWALAVSLLREQIVRPLQTLSNVVAALREDDYSFRARGAMRSDAMGDLALEVNALASMMQSQRVGAMEAMALVQRMVESMQAPVLAFDPDGRLRLLNAAGEKIFALKASTVLSKKADTLDLAHLLTAEDGELVSIREGEIGPRQGTERWMVKRSYFRLGGVRHTLLILSDVSAALRDEERLAWERLIRVLGHEINNSLTPIKSIANSLRSRLVTITRSGVEVDSDFDRGLGVIENRAESLNRFLQAYRQLMRVPVPKVQPVPLHSLMQRVVHLETRLTVTMLDCEDLTVRADEDQLQQALINLIRNAAEAALAAAAELNGTAAVDVSWKKSGAEAVVQVRDNGPGLLNEGNLFVPFYTTKQGGTGIGLVLVQQIAEAHGGAVRLPNRSDGPGCIAELRLPIAHAPAS